MACYNIYFAARFVKNWFLCQLNLLLDITMMQGDATVDENSCYVDKE